MDLIMYGPEFFGTAPGFLRWSEDSTRLRFRWKRWDEDLAGTYEFRLIDDTVARLEAGTKQRPVEVTSQNGKWRLNYLDGTLKLVDAETHAVKEIDRREERWVEMVFAPDGQSLLLRNGSGIYRFFLNESRMLQLLAFKTGVREDHTKEAKEKKELESRKEEGLAGWHKKEQRGLFRLLHERYQRQEEARKRRADDDEKALPTYRPPRGFDVRGASTSPSGAFAAVSLRTARVKPRVADMPDYVTEDGYSKMRRTRAKVGDASGASAVEIVDLFDGGGVRRVTFGEVSEGISVMRPRWSPDGKHLVVSARSDNDEDRWLLKVDIRTGETEILHHVHDDAWVLGSTLSPMRLGRTNRIMFLSEQTGYRHLYIVDLDSGEERQLTQGAFEVSSPQATPDGSVIYAVATPRSPHLRDLVKIDVESGQMEILPGEGGGRTFALSPDGRMAAEVHSASNTPPELVIRWLDGSRPLRRLTDSPSPAFKSQTWLKPPVVWIPASDGVDVPARIYRPKDPLPGRPAVLFVHGAGYLQNVHHWWSSYSREYGFHHLLMDEGFTVLDVDYRGSSGYGRDWRTAIYGFMGGRDLDDFVDAARYLVTHEGCSPDRIGIYGGSYGGFITLMGLFTKPGVFSAGAALRPVTDWAHYNDGYTSNILDDPTESPEFYRKSSPLYHAEGLSDHLLICHGLLDDNVHVQGVFRLQQRLIELRKRTFEVATYPLERHGFQDPASWSDEYSRIHALFSRVLMR